MEKHGGIKIIRGALLALALIVFLGNIMMWIVMPTHFYDAKWWPQVKADMDSSYFGIQGPIMLEFTFPILFIAVLGCIYNHLGKKLNDGNSESVGKHLLGIWKRPLVINGLGIVSRIELTFFLMFITFLVWCFSEYLHVAFAEITSKSAAKSGDKVWEARLESAAAILGAVGNIGLAFLFFPVTRASSVLPLFGLTSEASVKYHIWVGHMVMTLFTAHGVCYVILWAATNHLSEMLKWAKAGISNVAGEIALLVGLTMWVTTFPRIRLKMFELFFYTHQLYIIFMVFYVFHLGIIYVYFVLPGFYLFMIDRFLRFLQSRQGVRLVSARILPCEVVELNFAKSKGLSYTPTSILFINIPNLSKQQWHPFTISSSSNLEPEKLSLLIKGERSWSKKLHQMLASPSSIEHLHVSVEGPYGPISTDFLRHNILVMISGGSGIAPFISIIRELIYMQETFKCQTPGILLISAFKNYSDLTMLDIILPISGAISKISELRLRIEAYITREIQQPEGQDKKNLISSIWFNPKPSDLPITPILGQNNWLWLGAIISSSFIIFLLSMGLLTRYYIYPIDHNNNNIYSYPSRAMLNMLIICLTIMTTTTTAFLWNKGYGGETKQTRNMEPSQDLWFYNSGRELESLPNHSLVQCTNLHYGQRPDLKKILLDCKESSVGVLVCGPKKMRHEVAKICSARLSSNLHFESISFSW